MVPELLKQGSVKDVHGDDMEKLLAFMDAHEEITQTELGSHFEIVLEDVTKMCNEVECLRDRPKRSE